MDEGEDDGNEGEDGQEQYEYGDEEDEEVIDYENMDEEQRRQLQ